MILLIKFADGVEEAFQVPPTTKLTGQPKLGYWRFTLTTGAQVAYAEEEVKRLELGNVQFADDRDRVDADGAT